MESHPLSTKSVQQSMDFWQPALLSIDREHLPEMPLLNSRARDIKRTHGYANGAEQIYVDNIVGHQFRLSAKPNYKVLGLDAEKASLWAKDVEARFTDWAEDPDCWIDAEEKRTLTMMARESVRHYASQGEILASAEWRRASNNHRPQTCIKLIDSERLSNPFEQADTQHLRAGVELGNRGQAMAYHIRCAHPGDVDLALDAYIWKKVKRRKPWGRLQVLHVFEPERPDQTRGINVFVSTLRNLKMLEQFQDATLQNAIVNAMYAAVIQSEFDPQTVLAALGGGEPNNGSQNTLNSYMHAVQSYHQGANNIHYNGARIPHLFPNEKLELKTAKSNPYFENFEDTLLRHIAASLNISFEQLSRDFSKTNYSSARASMLESWKFFLSVRHIIPARFCQQIYALWLEEMINKGVIELPGNANFYQNPSAWTRCYWIAQGQTHIDGVKEVERLERLYALGAITFEEICMMLGKDYQEVLEQRQREAQEFKAYGLSPFSPSFNPVVSKATEE
ncbi:phage portal protein [Zooshikella sp. RANM57]|uniref:phage portal protein n=1 Tax=Zooshikella sp. RANM57 TaxID=3425863 RepID=UPI003D6F3375